MNRSIPVLVFTGLLTASAAAQQTPPPVKPVAAPTATAPTMAAPSRTQRTPAPAVAQTAVPTPRAPMPPAAAAMPFVSDPAQQVNVRVELAISETGGPAGPTRKTVSVLTAGAKRGSVRSGVDLPGYNMRLSVDALPAILKDGRIALDVIFSYSPERGQQATSVFDLNEQMSVILNDGKPLQISQSADPKGDRKVTVEVTATVVK